MKVSRVFPLAIVWLVASCASSRSSRESIQPFHVAIVPIAAPTRLDGPDESSSDVALAIDAARLEREIERSLGASCFARVTLLAPPDGTTREDVDRLDSRRRDELWIARANEAGADLVLECDVAATPRFSGSKNEKFWLNLPLFLFGGPGCYFVADRTYRGDVRLRASLYELHALVDGRATFGDQRSRLAEVEARVQEQSLDFLDRANHSAAQYAASFVVPAGLLARSGPGVEAALAEHVGNELARGLTRELALQSREIAAAERVAPFRFDGPPRVVDDGESFVVTGSVLLACGDVDRLETWNVRSGSALAGGEFGDGTPDPALSTRRERVLRYPFVARLPRGGCTDFARVELAGGGRASPVRSFTIELAGAERRAAEPSSAREHDTRTAALRPEWTGGGPTTERNFP